MPLLLNPTGNPIRSDAMGSGAFDAPRGRRRHNGEDYICAPGQDIVSPINGLFSRISRPYDRGIYTGLEILGEDIHIKLFYVSPSVKIGFVKQGQVVGKAQDISLKYGADMTPHVHLRIDRIAPSILMGEEWKLKLK